MSSFLKKLSVSLLFAAMSMFERSGSGLESVLTSTSTGGAVSISTRAVAAKRGLPKKAKTLAAGAIKPQEGFKYAFDNGADFICVGMYDFQIVEDVNIVLDTLANVNRTRPWRG